MVGSRLQLLLNTVVNLNEQIYQKKVQTRRRQVRDMESDRGQITATREREGRERRTHHTTHPNSMQQNSCDPVCYHRDRLL